MQKIHSKQGRMEWAAPMRRGGDVPRSAAQVNGRARFSQMLLRVLCIPSVSDGMIITDNNDSITTTTTTTNHNDNNNNNNNDNSQHNDNGSETAQAAANLLVVAARAPRTSRRDGGQESRREPFRRVSHPGLPCADRQLDG